MLSCLGQNHSEDPYASFRIDEFPSRPHPIFCLANRNTTLPHADALICADGIRATGDYAGFFRHVDRESRPFGRPRHSGIPFRPKAGAAATLEVHADRGRETVQQLGEDESYELTVTDSGAKLNAATPLGVLHGLQTFLQLVQITPAGFAVPIVTIKDQPRFAWRGTLIDVF
jgi:hypothetical protein